MPRPRLNIESIRQALQRSRSSTAAQLADRLGLSQPSISRGLAMLGDEVVRIGQGRTARYALRRSVGRWGGSRPLHRIRTDGKPEYVGMLHALHQGAWLVACEQKTAWMQGEFSQGLFPDLPWFLDDMRPQGYLGRTFVHAYAEELDAPEELNLWQSEHVLAALLSHGENLPGNLVIGEKMLEQALREIITPSDVIALHDRAQHYPQRAQAALQGRPIGSSAGGEQPKFTALLLEPENQYRAVVVKFSEPMNASASAVRWADLLQCEHLAAQVLRKAGIAAAETHVLDAEGRRFLQSTRFDRTANLGRRGYVSLRSLDAAYIGKASAPWTEMADSLLAQRWLSESDAETLRTIGLFGGLIGNTDMHFGNLAFEFSDTAPFSLVPVFDMLPMLYAPASNGEIVERELNPPLPMPRYYREWTRALQMAIQFWNALTKDVWISAGFQTIAKQNEQKLQQMMDRFG